MLTGAQILLLTASLDGEADLEACLEGEALLRDSAEARFWYGAQRSLGEALRRALPPLDAPLGWILGAMKLANTRPDGPHTGRSPMIAMNLALLPLHRHRLDVRGHSAPGALRQVRRWKVRF